MDEELGCHLGDLRITNRGIIMICLRCGYCCIKYDVVIVEDPDKGICEGNLVHKETGVRCPHLRGDVEGNMSCAVHDREWYSETPCYSHGQIEKSPKDQCRIGARRLQKAKQVLN
jgi:Fe-S-cluster containining protein